MKTLETIIQSEVSQKKKDKCQVHNIASRPSPRKRKAKRQNVCLRRTYKQLRKEEKLKAKEKGKDIHLNADFQRTARRDKKAFLSEQRKEIEENNRTGKVKDLFKKIRDTKGTFQAKMGKIKDKMVWT